MRTLIPLVILLAWSVTAATPTLSSRAVGSGFNLPDAIAAIPGDTAHLYICEQHSGQILILNLADGSINPTPFLTIPGVTQGSEQGLLGLCFDPNYASNGYLYVNVTLIGGGAAGHTEIQRYTASGTPATATTADLASKVIVIQYDQPETNHNGGWLAFGPDQNLYIGVGDGGGGYDAHGAIGNGQDRTVLLGKILRINVAALPYTIPADNPFAASGAFKKEIWDFGLRNPFRCSFDRQTGDLWIGDVGQDTREEVDFAPVGQGGLNFGWRPREGTIATPTINETPVTPATDPLVDYDHSIGVNAVIGGYVYRGSAIAGLQGTYIHADYGSARFWALTQSAGALASQQEITSQINPGNRATAISTFGEDANGELYYADYAAGKIYAILGPIQIGPSNSTLPAGTVGTNYSALFTATGGSAPYTWSVLSGTLPAGLTLSSTGVLSGTPTASGPSTFTVGVQDSLAATGSQAYTLTINPLINGGGGGSTLPLTVTKLGAAVKFNVTAHDTLQVSGAIPNLPAGFAPTGVPVTLNVSGATVPFTLDAKGHAKTAQGTLALQVKLKRDRTTHIATFPGGNVNFTAHLKNGTFAGFWLSLGVNPLKDAKSQPVTLTVDLTLQSQLYEAAVPTLYSARANKNGTLRK